MKLFSVCESLILVSTVALLMPACGGRSDGHRNNSKPAVAAQTAGINSTEPASEFPSDDPVDIVPDSKKPTDKAKVSDFGYNTERGEFDSHAHRTTFSNFNLLPRFVDKPYELAAAPVIEAWNPQKEDAQSGLYVMKIVSRLREHAAGNNIYSQTYVWPSPKIFWFGIPGGKLYISSGLINSVDNESELAGVIAHELGHLYLRHYTSLFTKKTLTFVPSGFLSWLGVLVFAAPQAALSYKFSRDEEREADIAGAQMAFDAGYDPRGFIKYLVNRNIQYGKNDATQSPVFKAHPYTVDRVTDIEVEVAKMGGAPAIYQIDSPEFRQLKRLQSIPLDQGENVQRLSAQ